MPSTLRSMTHGRGRFHAEVSHYQVLTGPLPKSAQATRPSRDTAC